MKAVIYARYSSDSQREESIDGQLRECKVYADKNDIVILDTYIDRALSAKTDNRLEFQRMIKDSASGVFDIILVWKLDRFARNRYDSAHYKALLKKNGVRVVSAKETISDGPEGIILESMLEGYAEYYSAELSQKIIRGMTDNVLNAKFNGGGKTFGYIIDENKHFQPDPVYAPIVNEIFTRYAEGAGTMSTLSSLKARGIKNSKGKTPGYNFITTILKNRRYLGEYRFRDIVVENAFEPLISKDLFDKCQHRLEANKRKPAHFKTVEEKYILTGKIFCGYCGDTMAGVSGTSHTGAVYRYYYCHNAKKKKTCKKKRIAKDLIENTVIDCTLKLLDNDKLIKQIVNTCYEMQSAENTAIKVLQKQLKQAKNEIDNIMSAIKRGIVTESTKTELLRLEEEKSTLQANIAKEQIKRPFLSKEQIECWIHKFKSTDTANPTQKQQLIDVFINAVFVYDDKILITFNYKDDEECIDFKDIQKIADKKTNLDKSSPLSLFGGDEGDRTPDLVHAKHALSQLSYTPMALK